MTTVELSHTRSIAQNYRMISVRFQGKPFNITVIQAYAPTSNHGQGHPSLKADLQTNDR